MADLHVIPLKARRSIWSLWSQWYFLLMRKGNLLKIITLSKRVEKRLLMNRTFCISQVREILCLSLKSQGILKRDACRNGVCTSEYHDFVHLQVWNKNRKIISKIEYWTICIIHNCFCFSNWPHLLALSEKDWNCGCHWLGALDFTDHVHIPECFDVLLHGSVNSVTAVQGWHDCHGSYPENWHW